MPSDKHALWVEKYQPATLKDYIFHDKKHQTAFEQMVKDKTIPHLLLSGVQGSGKTAIARVLINELGLDPVDVLIINGSDENSVEIMREKIKNFIMTAAIGDFKVVQLEECDYLTLSSQAVLRKYMEEPNSPARFILTCNYENKIMPAIKSRSQQFSFKASNINKITEYAAKILIKENVKFSLELLDKYISIHYPDIRKTINAIQQNTINNVLQPLLSASESGDYKFKLLDYISDDNWLKARLLACANVPKEEWDDLYRFLYENLNKSKKFSDTQKWESGIVIIVDHLYKNSIIADPELNGAAMFIRLSQI